MKSFLFIYSRRQYTWLEERGKKLKCTAPQYIDYVMTFCQKCLSNQELFPTKYGEWIFAMVDIRSEPVDFNLGGAEP